MCQHGFLIQEHPLSGGHPNVPAWVPHSRAPTIWWAPQCASMGSSFKSTHYLVGTPMCRHGFLIQEHPLSGGHPNVLAWFLIQEHPLSGGHPNVPAWVPHSRAPTIWWAPQCAGMGSSFKSTHYLVGTPMCQHGFLIQEHPLSGGHPNVLAWVPHSRAPTIWWAPQCASMGSSFKSTHYLVGTPMCRHGFLIQEHPLSGGHPNVPAWVPHSRAPTIWWAPQCAGMVPHSRAPTIWWAPQCAGMGSSFNSTHYPVGTPMCWHGSSFKSTHYLVGTPMCRHGFLIQEHPLSGGHPNVLAWFLIQQHPLSGGHPNVPAWVPHSRAPTIWWAPQCAGMGSSFKSTHYLVGTPMCRHGSSFKSTHYLVGTPMCQHGFLIQEHPLSGGHPNVPAWVPHSRAPDIQWAPQCAGMVPHSRAPTIWWAPQCASMGSSFKSTHYLVGTPMCRHGFLIQEHPISSGHPNGGVHMNRSLNQTLDIIYSPSENIFRTVQSSPPWFSTVCFPSSQMTFHVSSCPSWCYPPIFFWSYRFNNVCK